LGRCVSAGRQVTFSVFQDLVRDLLGLPDGAGRDAISQRLERVIGELNLAPSLSGILKPLYGGARSVLPEQLPLIAAALRDVVGAMTLNSKTMVLVIEDLHWADEPSRAVIGRLADILKRERLLLLLTARSDVDSQWIQ